MKNKSNENIDSTNTWNPVHGLVRRVCIGMKVMIKDKAIVGNDCKFGKWKNEGEVFFVDSKLHNHKNRYVLRGNGWGNKNDYGNGVVFVNKADLVHA